MDILNGPERNQMDILKTSDKCNFRMDLITMLCTSTLDTSPDPYNDLGLTSTDPYNDLVLTSHYSYNELVLTSPDPYNGLELTSQTLTMTLTSHDLTMTLY